MKQRPHLVRRGNQFYFRRRVPTDLVPAIGATEIKVSLGTGDLSVASVKAAKLDAEWTERFHWQRAQGAPQDPLQSRPLTEAEARWVVDGPAAQLAVDDATSRASGDQMALDVLGDRYSELDIEARAVVRGGRSWVMERAVRERLAALGVAADGLDDYRRLVYAYASAQARALRDVAARVRGEPVEVPPMAPLPPSLRAGSRAASQRGNLQLADVIDRWAKEAQPAPQTVDMNRSIVREFGRVTGTTGAAITDITSDHVVRFKEWMMEQGDRAPRTVRKRLTAVKTLLRYAKANQLIGAVPGADVTVTVPKARARYPFSGADLERLFAVPAFKSDSHTNWLAPSGKPGTRPDVAGREAAFWLPVMCLLTGARIEELAQLRVADLQRSMKGTWFLDITDEAEGQRLKTESSRRRVPLHPELLRLGLPAYGATLPQDGHLFPHLKVDKKYGKRSKRWSEWFNEYLRTDAVGIRDTHKTLHSFRHTFKDMCREAGVPADVSHALTGHLAVDVGSSYGQGFSVDVLAEHLRKMQLPPAVSLATAFSEALSAG